MTSHVRSPYFTHHPRAPYVAPAPIAPADLTPVQFAALDVAGRAHLFAQDPDRYRVLRDSSANGVES